MWSNELREASQHLPNIYHKNLMVLVTGFKHGVAKTIQDLPGAFWATLVYVVKVFLSSISGLPFQRPLRYGHFDKREEGLERCKI